MNLPKLLDRVSRATRAGGCALALACIATAADAATVWLNAPTTSYTVGQRFDVDVRIDGAFDLYAWQFSLGFDPTQLEVLSVVEGAFLADAGPTLFIDGTLDNGAGTVEAVANAMNGAVVGVDGAGVLATFKFNAIGAGTSSIALYDVTLLDSNLVDLQLQVGGPLPLTVARASDPTPNPVPEPALPALLAAGAMALAMGRRRSA